MVVGSRFKVQIPRPQPAETQIQYVCDIVFFFFGSGHQTWGLVLAQQTLHHQALPPEPPSENLTFQLILIWVCCGPLFGIHSARKIRNLLSIENQEIITQHRRDSAFQFGNTQGSPLMSALQLPFLHTGVT